MVPPLMTYFYLLMIGVVQEEEEVDVTVEGEEVMVVEVAEETYADVEEDIIPPPLLSTATVTKIS